MVFFVFTYLIVFEKNMLEKEQETKQKNNYYLKNIENSLHEIEEIDKYFKTRWVRGQIIKGIAIAIGGSLSALCFPFVTFGDVVDIVGIVGVSLYIQTSITNASAIKQEALEEKNIDTLLGLLISYKSLVEDIVVNIKELTDLSNNDNIQILTTKEMNEVNGLIKKVQSQVIHLDFLLKEEENMKNKDDFISMITFVEKNLLKDVKKIMKQIQ